VNEGTKFSALGKQREQPIKLYSQ